MLSCCKSSSPFFFGLLLSIVLCMCLLMREREHSSFNLLLQQPENMLRRLSLFKTVSNLGPHTKITEFDAATYPWNYQMQSTIYKRTKKVCLFSALHVLCSKMNHQAIME